MVMDHSSRSWLQSMAKVIGHIHGHSPWLRLMVTVTVVKVSVSVSVTHVGRMVKLTTLASSSSCSSIRSCTSHTAVR